MFIERGDFKVQEAINYGDDRTNQVKEAVGEIEQIIKEPHLMIV